MNDEAPVTEDKPTTERQHGCVTAIVVGAVLFVVMILGFVWLQSALAGLVQSGTMANSYVGAFYGLALLVPFGLAAFFLKQDGFELWRGLGLALAITGGYAILSNLVLTIDQMMVWPGLPMSLLPAVSIVYGLAVLVFLRKRIGYAPPVWIMLLGAGLALLISIPWGITGVLGTGLETMIGFFEAIGSGLVASVIVAAVFYYDDAFLRERPFWSAVIAGFTFWAIKSGILTVRGYWLQPTLLTLGLIPAGFAGGAVLALAATDEDRPLRGWWAVFAFLTVLFMLPFMFTEGFEGEWMPDQMGNPWGIGATAMFGAGIVVSGVSLGLVKVLYKQGVTWWLSTGVSIVALLGFGVPYLLAGQPGIQPETFFVVMADQADTSFARDIEDRDERVRAVYDTLVDQADRTQADLRMVLDREGVDYTPYYLVNGIEVEGTRGLRRRIAQRVDVARVIENPLTRPLPDFVSGPDWPNEDMVRGDLVTWGPDEIDADRVWDELGVTGEGIVVGHADSGVAWEHGEFRDRYLGSEDSHDYAWFDPWEGTTEPTDGGGHGTYTLGSVLGRSGIGVAPGANWIACRNLARNLGAPSYYLDCMQFLFAPFPLGGDPLHDGDPLRGAHVTNNSWGCPPQEGCDGITLGIGVTNLRNAGQMMVVSAGNDGPNCGTVSAPATADDAFSVGAMARDGSIAGFSSRGPVEVDGSGRPKPDIAAPGVDIESAAPGGYQTSSGTSAAAPHVTGVVALMWSANPDLIGDVDLTEQIITETAHFVSVPDLCGGNDGEHNNVYGYGVVDAFAAVSRALEVDN